MDRTRWIRFAHFVSRHQFNSSLFTQAMAFRQFRARRYFRGFKGYSRHAQSFADSRAYELFPLFPGSLFNRPSRGKKWNCGIAITGAERVIERELAGAFQHLIDPPRRAVPEQIVAANTTAMT